MFLSFCLQSSNLILLYIYIYIAVGRPSLSKFHRDHIHKARLHANRSFHSLVTFQRLAMWGLGPEPSIEALAHEFTVRRREFFYLFFIYVYLEISQVLFDLYFLTNILCFSTRDGNYEGE